MATTMDMFRAQVERDLGLRFADFEALHRWSVADQSAFWGALWLFEGIESATEYTEVLRDAAMPGAQWFAGARINYARHALRHANLAALAGVPAIIAEDESGIVVEMSWIELRRQVASLALEFRRIGLVSGDRVAAYLPNRVEAIVAFLATASIGAIWTICSPDMGAAAILDRFQQVEPRLLIATDAVRYAGKAIDRSDVVRELRAALPTVETTILVRSGIGSATCPSDLDFAAAVARDDDVVRAFEPEWLPFDHPLWIVYSSGTTGKPKALVHGHGGIVLNAAATRLHNDLRASYDAERPGERFHWYSSTGWMMWNSQVGGLLGGATICIYDGSPAGPKSDPDWGVLWRFAARHRVTFFGAGAPFYTACLRNGLDWAKVGDLSRIRILGSTAAPLPAAVQTGLSEAFVDAGYTRPLWFNSSGGTDICGAFCTGNFELPEAPGKLQCRQLGAAVEAWDEAGAPVIGAVGELVCVRPLPSMPLFLWGDTNNERYRSTYLDTYPGVWRHGDWLKIDQDGTCEIFGRSDATINRGGHRLGTSEIYDAVEALPHIEDSLAVDVQTDEGESSLLLFIVSNASTDEDDGLPLRIAEVIRENLSPRFVPDVVIRVRAIPRTLSSKKQELPVKRLFQPSTTRQALDLSSTADPEAMLEFERMGRAFVASPAAFAVEFSLAGKPK